jgi:hypothetical protein
VFPNVPITYEAVNQVVQDCPKCAKIRDNSLVDHTQTKILPTYHANAMVNVDVLTIVKDTHGFLYVFVFINCFTKYTIIIPAKDKTARTCAMCMLAHASVVGVTECVMSDNGPEFCAEVTQELADILGITWTFTLAYRPQSNGIVERQNSEILRRLRVMLLYKDTWNRWSEPHVISLVQLALNTRVHGTTGYAAVELTFGTAARQYHKAPDAMNRAEHEDLLDFNAALTNVQEAARHNIMASQLPRLKNQPEIIVTYEQGDLVLRNPRKLTGATGMRTNKLEPTYWGPYKVIRQERTGQEWSNAVLVSEVNDTDKEHTFHASTLKIFTGTLEQAKELATQDRLEYTITRMLNMTGNTVNRDSLIITVELEDQTVQELTYQEASKTQAYMEYCEKLTIGKELSLTREEIVQYCKEQNPGDRQSVTQRMQQWHEEERIQVNDRRYITAHHWNSATWSIHDNPTTLPNALRNKEPLMEAIVVKLCNKTVDLEIPVLAFTTGARTRKYVISMSLAKLLLYTTTEDNIRELSRVMDNAMMGKCTLRQDIHLAAGY